LIHQVIKNNLYKSIVTALLPIVIQLYFVRYVSYNVDKDVYGNFVILQIFVISLSSILLTMPLNAFTRFYNESTNKLKFLNEFRSILLLMIIIGFFAFIVYAIIFSRFDFSTLIILLLYFISMSSFSLDKEVFLLKLERRKYFYLQMFEAGAKFLMPIVFYSIYETLDSFLFGIFFGYLLAVIFLRLNLRDHPFKFSLNWNNLRIYFSYSYPTIFLSMFGWGVNFSDRYFIDYFLKLEDVSIYAILAQLAGLGYIFGRIYTLHVNPIIYKEYKKDSVQSFHILLSYTRRLVFFLVAMFLLFLALPREIFLIILTESIINSEYYYDVLVVLSVSIFFAVIQNAYSMFFSLEKKLKIVAYFYFFAFILNLVGNLYIQNYGIIAAAYSTLAAFLFINIMQIYYLKKHILRTHPNME